ncbi:MAG: gluconokinase [Cyclobacteriaceae bacterium]|nr:gluconokinase [Cyclobacteriaceae bacterium]
MNSVLAIDIGTTSTKGLLITSQGVVLASHQVAYPTSYPQPHFAEQNPQEIFDAVVYVIHTIAAHNEVTVISFSAAMHSIMVVNQEGKPLSPLIIWADTRSIAQSRDLEKIRQALYEETGTPVHPMSPLCKLLWWKEHQPNLLVQAHKFISIKEYVIFRLTGQFLIDHSIASATGIFNLSMLGWSATALNQLGVPFDKFSDPVPTDFSVELTTEQSAFLELKNSVKLIIGASDGCCAQLGSGATQEEDISITVGTSGAVRKMSKTRVMDPQGRVFNYILDQRNFVCGGATNNATAVIHWFAKQFLQKPSITLTEFIDQTNQIQAGAEGLLFLPYVFGERAPVYDAATSGVFLGVTVQHTLLHLQKAVAEGICFALKSILETIHVSSAPSRLIVSGGITYSPEWLQMLSDVLDKELQVATDHDASAVGVAMIAFRAQGIEFQQSQQTILRVLPNTDRALVYEKSYAVYKTLYESLKSTFHTHHQLMNSCR